MFEAQVLGLLQRYLGKYVYGLDAESLRISVWRGDVELSNLRLKPEALDELNLPVTVKSGLLGQLRLKVPWSKLGTEPVVAEFDRLYIVASPREDDSSKGACPEDVGDAVAAAEKTEQAAKQRRIDTAEDTWLKDVAAKDSNAATDDGSGGTVGRLRALVDTIIGNLELKISNIHIRYEDSTSNPGHTFCIGVLLSEISAHTVGEDWQRKFVTADALLTLRKCVQLKSLAIYFDCDKPLLEPGKRWDLITVTRWDDMMLPAKQLNSSQQATQQQQQPAAPAAAAAWVASSTSSTPPQQQHQAAPQHSPAQHQFLLCPVDGTLRYVRRGRAARKDEKDAEQEVQLQLVQIGVQVHQLQYQSSQKLLQEFDRYAAGAPHRHLRPHCRPSTAAGARLWWRYAITVVQRQQQSYSSRAWKQLRMLAYYQRYVTAYLKYLQQGKQGSGDPTIDKLDAQLDEAVILLFRRMAHARLKELRAKATAAEVKQPAQQQTWIGWLMGSATKPAQQQAHTAEAAGSAGGAGELDTSMGVEEWNKLEDVLAQQADALAEDPNESPYRVRSVLKVQVSLAAVELQGAGGTLLMQASMCGVDSKAVLYPKTQDIAFSVSTFGVTSSHGPLISSGLITTSSKTGAAPTSATGQAASALDVRMLRDPQDNSADLILRVAIAPSYVTYSKAAVLDVVGFFRSEESVELSRLQAQAAARTDKLRHMAQLQLQALSERSAQQNPRMKLMMTLHAPKVAIPDASGGITLIADLGCFTISSNTAAAKSLTAEEAALYECFVVRVDHVSAYLLDGHFAWPSTEEITEASGGLLPAAASSGMAGGAAVAPEAAATPADAPVSVLQELLGRRARIVPLLYRFGLGMDLQVSTSVHPRYPVVRLAVAASPLQLHLSPYRYQQLMTVLQSALATPAGAAADGPSDTAAAGSDKPLWLSESEYTAKVALLTWEGLTGSVAKWQSHRWVHVWRGRLYLAAHRDDAETLLSKTYWMGYRVVQLQPSVVGGCDNVVAVVPKGAKLDTVTESTDAVILRAQDVAAAQELRKRLTASANQMSAVAGLLDLDESAEADASVGTTKDVFEELLSHQLLLQMYGSISEVSLLIAGRSPVSWWPPDGITSQASASSTLAHARSSSVQSELPSPAPAAAAALESVSTSGQPHELALTSSGAGAFAAAAADALAASMSGQQAPGGSSSSTAAGLLVPLAEEVDLVAIKFQGAQVGVTVSGDGFSTEVAMAALTIDDLLVGAKNPDKAHMARSSTVWQQQKSPKQEQPRPPENLQQQQQQPGEQGKAATGTAEEADAAAFRTVDDEGPDEDEEFYDADEGDSSTPRSSRKSSGSGVGGPLAHSITMSSTTSTPMDDSWPSSASGSGGRQHWSQGGGSMGGLRDLLPSTGVHEEMAAGVWGESDASSVLPAPSFTEALREFESARSSTQNQQQAADATAGSSGAGGAHAAASSQDQGQQELVRLLFVRYNPTSSSYTGLDVEVALRLSTLVFYCNRPTVAALMVFGTDLGAVNTLLAAPSAADEQGSSGQGAELAATESSVTDSESMSDVQLLRSGGDERTLFKLTLQVTKVELLLNYEGTVSHPLAIGSIDNFLLELAVHPATLQLHTSLGNMVVEYGALPKSNPNRTMLSVRDKQAGSLIDVVFKMHSLEQSFTEPRVPGGVQYMSVVTHLSTVQIVFMNRFLVEFLDYLAAMLAMQAPPKELPGAAADTAPTTSQQQPQPPQDSGTAKAGAASAPTTAATSAAAAAKPVVVLLDVNLEAPVLVLPLDSGSDDNIEVDLGTLELNNLVVWEMRYEDKDRQKLLVDDMQIKLQKVSGCVIENGVRGRNIIREMGEGVSVSVRRPLLADPLPLPPISTAVTVPKLRASLLDTEYALILAILAGNFAEAAQLPPEVSWLHSHLLGDRLAAAAPAAAGQPGSPAAAAGSDKIGRTLSISAAPAVAAAAVVEDDSETIEMKRQVVSDFSCTNASLLGLLCDSITTKTTVSIGHAQLMLWNAQPQGLPPAAVGSIELKDLWVAVSMTQKSNMLLWLSLPSVCARDLRPGVPREASLVLSTAEIGAGTDLGGALSGTGATSLPTACPRQRDSSSGSSSSQQAIAGPLPSLLTLQYRAVTSLGPEPAAALQVRLQRPTLVLDVGFIMKVLHFVAPSAGLQGPVPRPYATHEVHLGPEPYLAPDHLWLSPEYRIIADAPGLHEAVYDGRGHALVLPAAVPSIEHMPLIVVGRGVTLRLRNVKVVNQAGLAGVLSLAPGGRLVAEEADGVSWHGPEEALRLRNKMGRRILIQASRLEGQDDKPPAAAAGTMTIAVHAVGAAVYLIDAHAAAGVGAAGAEAPGAQEAAAPGISIPMAGAAESGSAGIAEGAAAGQSWDSADSADSAGGARDKAVLLRMLALYLDCGVDMEMQGTTSKIVAQLIGLSIKAQTRLLEDAAAAASAAAQQGPPASHSDGTSGRAQQPTSQEQPAQAMQQQQQQQQVATSILEPCDIRVSMKADDAVQDINVDVSALQLRMSPDVMQLLLHLQQVVMEPLAVPPASQPLARVDKFVYVWSSHGPAEGCGTGPPYATAGAGGVDVIGSDRGVTVWRPQPPIGYALLGDVLAAGHSQPDHQVIAVAISSGLLTYPLGFTRVWESPGISFWRPVPPEGYVSMGCIASASMPDRKQCVVVARQAVVTALLSECMMLCTNGNLWCIQNSMGTFEVAVPDTLQPKVPLYDLRSPLGVAPAALTPVHHQPSSAVATASHLLLKAAGALTEAPLPPSLVAARAFAASRTELRAKVASSGQVSSTVEFSRIWWDKHSKHPSMTQVSLWRPVPPPGYVTLGDCMVTGMYCPPNSALVIRDTDPSEHVEGRPPLLARPMSCLAVWMDGHKKARGDPNYLTLWKPVAPAGYVAMGLLASTGGREPASMSQVRCVRADLATRVDFQPNSPALIFYPYKQRAALAGWIADERAATFVVVSHDGSPQVLEGYRLKDAEQIKREQGGSLSFDRGRGTKEESAGGAARALQMSVSVGKTNLLLRNLLRTPILELEASKLNLGLSQEVCGVRRCFAYLTTSLWSYNQSLEVWEPIMEPWQLLLHMDINPNPHSSAGIASGSWIRLTSPHGCVHVTLAQTALNSCLDALTDWQAGSAAAADVLAADGSTDKQAAGKSGLAAADGLQVFTTFTNTLDTAAYMQLNYGEGRKQVVMLPPHAATPLTQPLPVPPSSHAPLTASRAPPVQLVFDILDGKLLSDLGGTGSVPELSVKVEVTGKLAKQLSAATEGMVTRAVPAKVKFDPSAQASHSAQQGLVVQPRQDITWNERFVLALPPDLAEQLLTPAPGDNPFEGVALQLKVTVMDGSGERGLGRVLSSTLVPVTFNWLLSQIQALLNVRADAAAAATSATAKAGAELQQHGQAGDSTASSAAGAKAASSAAKAYAVGWQEVLQLWRPGAAGTADASPVGPEQLKSASQDSGSTATAAAAAAAAAAAVSGDETAAPIMQLKVQLSLDDSQVTSSWYPHQVMRRRLDNLLSLSRNSSTANSQLQTLRPSSQGSGALRSLATDSRPPQLQHPSAGAWARSGSGSNRNALRLEGSDVWSPFSYSSLRRLIGAPAGAPHSGVVPIRAGPGLVLEMSYIGGQYQGRIRSLCQFFNSTDLVLEVSLLEDDDSSWTMLPQAASQGVPGRAGSSLGGAGGGEVEEEVFQYERYLPLRGWSADHLTALDPREYSRYKNGANSTNNFPKVPLSAGWEWENAWAVEKHPHLDPDGWAYAFDMSQFKWPPQAGAGVKKAHDFVRRRRWVRKRRRTALPPSVLDVAGADAAEQPLRRVLGQVQPGGSMPLPQDWKADNKQLQVRPLLLQQQQQQQPQGRPPSPQGAGDAAAVPSHAWSYGVSGGQQSLLLTSMEDGASRLLCCPTLGVQKAPEEAAAAATAGTGSVISPRSAAAAAPACWFTVMCEASELPLQGAVDVLTDWHITAQPPLTLRNDLPVAAHYVLWERPARGGSLVLRQQGRLEGWASINVYSVDMRQQVCLTFHPEGAEWADPDPVVISEGFLGSTAGVESTARQLPSSFCVSYTNSQASSGLQLRIHMQKHIDTELLASQRLRAAAAKAAAAGASSTAAAAAVLKDSPPDTWRMSYGAALAQGRPLTLSLSVPVWVVNGTQLPVAVGIVPITSPAGGGSTGDAAVPATGDPAGVSQESGIGGSTSVGHLRILDTEAFSTVTRPSDQVLIMGNSIELLSYPPDPATANQDSGSLRSQIAAELGVGSGTNNGVVTQWAAVFSVMGSRWSTPLVFNTVGAAAPGISGTAPVAEAVARLPRYDPVLIRARCQDGSVYEVTVRLESAGTGLPLATLVRLDPHMVVSNRSGYTLHLLQPEPINKALGGPAAPPSWVLSSDSGRSGSQGAWIASGGGAPGPAGSYGAASSRSSGTRQPSQGSAASAIQEATVVLRPGALAVPVSWPAGVSKRLLALTLPRQVNSSSSSAGSGSVRPSAADQLQQVDPMMWSEPFRVSYPATGVMQVLVPLYQLGTPGEPQPVDADTMAAALRVFKQLFRPSQQRSGPGGSSSTVEAPRPPLPPGAGTSKGGSSAQQELQQQQQQQGEAATGSSDNLPMLVHVAKRTDSGLLEYLAVTVNVSVEMPTPGCQHVVLQSLGGEPQQCLMNCTSSAIRFKQATPYSAWQLLPPFSATALVLSQPPDVLSGLAGGVTNPLQLPSCPEVILRDSDPATSGETACSFDIDSSGVARAANKRSGSSSSGGGGNGRGSSSGSGEAPAVFPLHGGDRQALAQVLPLLESVMGPAGPAEVPGAGSVAIGRTQLDRLLRVIPKPASVSMNQLRLAASIAGQDQLSPSSSLHVSLEVPALDVSLVDGRPQELLLLSMDGLVVEYHAGNSAGMAYNQVLLRLNLAQLDDMQHGTAFPVVLLAADKTVAEDSAADPLLFFTHVSQPSRFRGMLYTPCLVAHIAALRLQVSETLVWRLYSFMQGLAAGGNTSTSSSTGSSTSSSSATAAAAAAGGQSAAARPGTPSSRGRMVQAGSSTNLAATAGAGASAGATAAGPGCGSSAGDVQQVASADLPLKVDLLSLDDVPLVLSFKTERAIRPRWANQMWIFNTLGDMLDLEALQLTLPGLELEGIKAQRSALISYAAKQLQAQALAIAFNVFRSYGVLGTASKLLGVGSNITSAITGTSTAASGAGSSSGSERVGNVGQGIVKGTLTFGGGLLKGVTGIVVDPVAGAKQGGVRGFVTGVGKGLVGVPGQIIGGALSAASQVTEGLDASVSKMKEQITGSEALVAPRRRLPRCIRGDRILTPFAISPALGLALLHNSGVGPLASLVKGAGTPLNLGASLGSSDSSSSAADGVGDAYEAHLTLPLGNVAMITNYRLLMLSAPEFAVLEADVLSGRRTHVDSVPAGRLLWQLTWDQMLCVELAYHSQQRSAAPDGVIVHRKYRQGDEVLVHDVRCTPNTNQALWLYEAITAARSKYYVDPRREARGWRVTPVIAAEQQSNQEMPDVMPSMDFKRIWRSGAAGGGAGDTKHVSIWRPVGPPGYAALGDVAASGTGPPSGRPVKMYKDVLGAGDASGQVSMSRDGLPPLALPERFQIIYRDSGTSNPVSIWRPVPPKGYVELGHVVVPAIEEPPLSVVRVMRADLAQQTRVFSGPLWSGTSSDNMYWQCDLWQVDNLDSCSTFIAVRHNGTSSTRPDPDKARKPLY